MSRNAAYQSDSASAVLAADPIARHGSAHNGSLGMAVLTGIWLALYLVIHCIG